MSQLSQSQPEEFPLHMLPSRVSNFVEEAAAALGVDPALVAGACLATLAGCIGNRRRIVLKPTWSEACVLWIAIVMQSGSKKTPAISLVLERLQKREAAEIEESAACQAEYEELIQVWKEEPKNKRGAPPEKPEPASRLLVSDTTVEALLSVHARAPLGLLLHRDELGGWLQGFNQYKGGKGNDAQAWTELHQGKPCIIDRKGSGTLSVPRAAVSIVGGVQPELLRNAISGEHLHDGIASRLLFIAPPETPKEWTEATVGDETREKWAGLLDELLELQPNEDETPVDLPMSDKAKAVWVAYYNEHAQREEEEEGPLRAAMSKLEAATARFALVIQLAQNPQSEEIGSLAMEAGIQISNWFEGQARIVYQGLEETEEEQDRRTAHEWIRRRGGSTTRREFARLGPGRLRKRAHEVLEALVAAGLAEQCSARYVLCDCDSCDNP